MTDFSDSFVIKEENDSTEEYNNAEKEKINNNEENSDNKEKEKKIDNENKENPCLIILLIVYCVFFGLSLFIIIICNTLTFLSPPLRHSAEIQIAM